MKIVIVTPYFYPHTGGVENYVLNEAKQLKARGWQVVIVTTGHGSGRVFNKTLQGLRVYYLPTALVLSNTPVGWRWRSKLRKIFESEKPDLINAHTPVPYLADLAERVRGPIPFVLTYHNDLQKNGWPYKGIVAFLNSTVISRTLKHSDRIITTSQLYADRSPYLRKYNSKTSIVPPGVDLVRFNPKTLYPTLQKQYKGQRVILFVGSLNKSQRHKGLEVLIPAFTKLHGELSDTKLVVVGSGDALSDYQEQARQSGLDNAVEFTGRISDAQLAQYYRLASVFTLPSLDDNEGFGMVFMEASASGTPVVGTRVGGIPYAVESGKTGLLVPSGNVTALEKALKSILENPELAREMGRAGAQRAAREFSWPLLADRMELILHDSAKPTIIQVAGYYPPHLGGMERVVQAMSERLADRHYDVRVLTSSIGFKPGYDKPHANLRLTRFKTWEFAHTPFMPGLIPALFKLPRRNSAIHLHLSQAFCPELVLLVSKLKHIPYVVHFHLDLQPSGLLGPLFKLYKATVIRAVIRHAASVVVFSAEQQAMIHGRYKLPIHKITVIPNGVGSEYFQPARDYSKGPKQLLFVGRLSSQKNLPLLLEVMALLPKQTKLTIVGDGEDRNELEHLSYKLGLSNVRFVGAKTPPETLVYYRQADVFIITSKLEGMPLAVLEAMAAGLPVVGPDVSGIREILKEVGLLVERPGSQTFAKVTSALLDSPERLEKLSRRSLSAANQYSWDLLVDRFESLYKRLVA